MEFRDDGPWHPASLFELVKRTVKDAKEDRVIGLGAEVAFFSILSFPPTMLAVFGSLGFLADWIGPERTQAIRDQILDLAGTLLSEGSLATFRGTIDNFIQEGRAGIAIFGVILALWSASRATKVFIEAVNIAYDIEETRSGIKRRLVALGITALGILSVLIILPLMVLGPRLGEIVGGPLGLSDLFAAAWRVLYWPTVGVIGIGLLATFYHFAPSWSTPWRRDMPGAVLAAVLWVAGAGGLRLYITISIAGDTSTYGSLATPIALLLWLYLTALALLLGAELNAEIERMWPTHESGPQDADEQPETKGSPQAPVSTPADGGQTPPGG